MADIANSDIVALVSDALTAAGNPQVLNTLRALGLTISSKAVFVLTIINNAAQALSLEVLTLLAPPAEDLFVTAQR